MSATRSPKFELKWKALQKYDKVLNYATVKQKILCSMTRIFLLIFRP